VDVDVVWFSICEKNGSTTVAESCRSMSMMDVVVHAVTECVGSYLR
jgi:hypothetical protein